MKIEGTNKFTPESRFTPPSNETANKRLHLFQTRVVAFQKTHPECLGATVFGSMVKGDNARNDSDVDACLYVDLDEFPETKGKTFTDDEEYDLRDRYYETFARYSGLQTTEPYGEYHVRVGLLSKSIIDRELAEPKSKLFKKVYIEYHKELAAKYKDIVSEAEKDTLIMREHRPLALSGEIVAIFHLRIGKGVQKYRHLLLEKLYRMRDKELAGYIWDDIYWDILKDEQGRAEVVTRNVPRKLMDALSVYHPAFYEKISRAESLNSISALIQDAGNQFMGLYYAHDIDIVKELIKKVPLKTLEEHTKKTTAELEKFRRGICGAYNSVIQELNNPNLTKERFDQVVEDGIAIARSLD